MKQSEYYYSRQADARGLTNSADVEKLADDMMLCYKRLLSPWLPQERNASIYEAACGPGVMLRCLKRFGYTNASGSDMSTCQIQLAKADGLQVVEGDSIEELRKCPDNHWDCIIAIDFIEHLERGSMVDFLNECHRTLKLGGVLIMRGPNADSPFVGRNLYNDITHVWAYTSVALRALLGLSGFSVVEFADESLASLKKHRWIKAPLMQVSQTVIRFVIRSATREDIKYLNPSIFVRAIK